MNRNQSKRRTVSRGFSLIEVLIAVVVLSVGLLALGALQASLVRNSTETKARSGALALAEERLEDFRAFGSRDEYQTAIVNGTETLSNTDQGIDASRGGVDYTRTTTVLRFGFNRAATPPQFIRVNNLTADLSSLNTTGVTFVNGREFKRVDVTVGWQDPVQGARTVRVNDVISAASPDESAQVLQRRQSGERRPQVLINDPSLEGGVIPIAIDAGDDARETAATNPRPVIAGQGNSSSVVETRYDVLTFQGAGDALSQVQKRVETSVIGCRCASGAASGAIAYRPTYWDGLRYKQPAVSTDAPTARAGTGTQSTLCTRCCADHQDPTGVAGAKFDPFRTDAHQHFTYDNAGNLVVAGTGSSFVESCRMIRVDGIWQTATDLNSEFFGFLATAGSPTAVEPLPSQAAQTAFQDFVIDYLSRTRVSGTSTDANALANDFGLNAPSSVEISVPTGSPACPGEHCRFLHARGVYLDYLEPAASDKIATALTNCTNTGSARVFCILPYLPFTTINTTELSRWASADLSKVAVTNTGPQIFGNASDPKAGRVNSFSTSVGGSSVNVNSVMGKSNAGVALYSAVDTHDAVTLGDTQAFRIADGSPPPMAGETFTASAVYPNATGARVPAIAWSIGTSEDNCSPPSENPVDGIPLLFSCPTDSPLNTAVTLTVSSYTKDETRDVQNPCQTNKNASKPACTIFDIVGVTGNEISRNVFNDGKRSEQTVINMNPVAPDEVIGIRFGAGTFVDATSYTCVGNGGKEVAWVDPCI